MKQLIKAIKQVKQEFLSASCPADKDDAAIRLGNLQAQLVDELIKQTDSAGQDDMYLVFVNDGEGRVISANENAQLARWCQGRKLPLTSVRVDKKMVSSLMEVI